MVHLVALSCRSDPIVLLCNREDLIYIWVFKPLDCSSPKSMWFLWNIFSKGTHMLQCLCGKSLKKNKNPSGKLMTIMPVYSVPLSRSLCVRESVTRRRARRCVIGLFVVTVIDLQSHLCSKWLMQSCGGEGEGRERGTTYSVLPLYQQRARLGFEDTDTRAPLPRPPRPASSRHRDLQLLRLRCTRNMSLSVCRCWNLCEQLILSPSLLQQRHPPPLSPPIHTNHFPMKRGCCFQPHRRR